ncbi:MAG: hypothetical protein CM15mP38_2620 [Synechococcus sp.]|nr:MAG: hypothetical protein CM15mP38_2620 [Synechococcus sp.]
MPVPPWPPGARAAPELALSAWRDYPDRSQTSASPGDGVLHGVDPDAVLPGNGAAELFTWAARDAAAEGVSGLLAPGFADYRRALQCWNALMDRQFPLP